MQRTNSRSQAWRIWGDSLRCPSRFRGTRPSPAKNGPGGTFSHRLISAPVPLTAQAHSRDKWATNEPRPWRGPDRFHWAETRCLLDTYMTSRVQSLSRKLAPLRRGSRCRMALAPQGQDDFAVHGACDCTRLDNLVFSAQFHRSHSFGCRSTCNPQSTRERPCRAHFRAEPACVRQPS